MNHKLKGDQINKNTRDYEQLSLVQAKLFHGLQLVIVNTTAAPAVRKCLKVEKKKTCERVVSMVFALL